MKKIKSLFKKNIIKNIICFVLGGIIFGTLGVYAATVLAANQVSYTKNSQTTVDGALDELFTRANTWIDPSTIQTNTTGKIFASSKGIVIRRNGTTHFIKANNWEEEQNHIQQVFSDVSCSGGSWSLNCNDSVFNCSVYVYGRVHCIDPSDGSSCSVDSDGSVYCD